MYNCKKEVKAMIHKRCFMFSELTAIQIMFCESIVKF